MKNSAAEMPSRDTQYLRGFQWRLGAYFEVRGISMKNIVAEMPTRDGEIKTVVARISVALDSVF